MFVSHEKNVGKKTFQKPNILRKKPKLASPQLIIDNESLGTKSLVTSSQHFNKSSISNFVEIKALEVSPTSTITKTSVSKLSIANKNLEENDNKSLETDEDANRNICAAISTNIIQNTDQVKSIGQSSLNVESFINNGTPIQNLSLSYVDKKISQARSKWCFNSINNVTDANDYIAAPLDNAEIKSDYVLDEVPVTSTVSQLPKESKEINESTPTQAVSVELFSNRAVKFKCDEPNCTKGFWSEERLRKHKNTHNRQPTVRPTAQITIECPVKKVLTDGVEEKCPRTFQVRRELLKHLNADHTPEDALHRCEVCGRRFFWAMGLRAHAQSVCARGGLACAWPGCGRVFRLPCRLREHARAHTGDRPYHCNYPECGWSFRSASKLLRHARRHTDERRHACGACGRAFLRREHLRDHATRHHLPAHVPRHLNLCQHPGCEQSFTNMSTLYMHMKKVHRKEETEIVTPATSEQTVTETETGENIYLVQVVGPGPGSGPGSAEGHAARTHCTWPLAPHARSAPQHNYVLEEDMPVENGEGSASNVYTVRSDLFLHGNVHIDDDSQNIGAEIVSSSETAAPLDTDLCLIDTNSPTIDLMPEGLMYEDAAVDESSFRVLLMNGELSL